MRSVYAAYLDFNEGTSPDDVLQIVGAWPARGALPSEVGQNWEPGTREYELSEPGHRFDVEVLEAPSGRLWHGSWRHPHSDDPSLTLVSEIAIAALADGRTSFSISIRPVWSRRIVNAPRFSMRAPRLVRDLVDSFEVHDAGRRLSSHAELLGGAEIDSLVYGLLLNYERTRPVVLVSHEPRGMETLIDHDELAAELAGLSHVIYTDRAETTTGISEVLGPLSCWGGAMRIWWPMMSRDDDPYRHRLYTPGTLRTWRGIPPAQHVFRTISAAAASNAAMSLGIKLRREARQAQLDTTDVPADWLNELDETFNELDNEREARAQAERENEEGQQALQEEQARREAAEERARSLAGQLLATSDPAAVAQALGSPTTVAQAVEMARPLLTHVVLSDRAASTAAASPYQNPADALEDLLKLQQLAEQWATREGLGGADLGTRARSMGLDWKSDVSSAAKGRNSAQYRFPWDGQEREVGPHVCRDRGSGAGRVFRIYLYKHEPDEAEERRLVVGHIGRHLDDSTT